MQSTTAYSWTFIIYILQLYLSLVFDFFQMYLKRFWDLVVNDFVENFKYYLLVIKTTSITETRERKS